MAEVFQVFQTAFLKILQVFLVMLAAGILVRYGIITQGHIQGIAAVAVEIFVPCMVFSSVSGNLHPNKLPIWWVLPVSAFAMIGAGLLISWHAFAREMPQKKNMLAVASIQNAGYLVLPVGQALFPDRFNEEFAVYTFLYVLGVSPILWSVGKYLATSGQGERLSWRALVTPPVIANILALVVVFTGVRGYIPAPVAESVSLMGTAAVPVATFVLGASLGSIRIRLRPFLWDAARALGIRMVLMPLLTVLFLRYTKWTAGYGLLGVFFVIQAAAPPATTTILQVRHYGGDEQKVGSILVVGYVLCAFTLPLWYAVWTVLE